ncbi:hypothetical protein ACWGI8_43180, partial [Streptomyces sp. NPDC054841]
HVTDRAVADGALLLDAAGSRAERAWPFGLARKLFEAAPLTSATRADVTHWMDIATAENAAEAQTRVLPHLAGALLELAADRLVVIAVDDAELSDELSLQLLMCLARRARRSRVLLLLTVSACLDQEQLSRVAELQRQAHCHRLRLMPLTPAAAERMLAGQVRGGDAGARLAAQLHERTGGNPLLMRALVEDHAAGEDDEGAVSLRAGEAWAGAVGEVLHRCGSDALRVARGTAVLGEDARTVLLGRLLDLPSAAVEAGVRELTLSGLFRDGAFHEGTAAAGAVRDAAFRAAALADGALGERVFQGRGLVHGGPGKAGFGDGALGDGAFGAGEGSERDGIRPEPPAGDGAFRDARSAAAVLGATPDAEAGRLRLRAAELLRGEGASAAKVARQLVRANEPAGSWAVPVLQQAAECALVDGDLDFARGCLALAQESCPDGPERTALKLRLAGVLWRSRPSALNEHLSALLPDMTGERLAPDELVVCVGYLVWLRRVDEAARVLDTLERSTTWTGAGRRAALVTARGWLAMVAPEHRTGTLDRLPDGTALSEPLGGSADVAHQQAAFAVAAALSGDGPQDAVRQATRVLQRYRLGDGYVLPLMFALWSLVYAGRTDLARPWCERLLVECKRYGTAWRAWLTAVRAEIALRQGDLGKAEEHARSALSMLPREDWGVAVHFPLATLISARTDMGRYDEAMDLLNHAAPGARLDTLPELHFRRARGRWSLATGRYHAALGDFLACGELLESWGMDVPELVPWRTDAADAWLALGEREKAVRLARE